MPRPRKSNPAANALISSAARMVGERMAIPQGTGSKPWQEQGWYFYDTVGEFRFLVDWKARACSQATLHIVEDQPDGSEKRIDSGPEVEALALLAGGVAGQQQMLHAMTTHLDVPGETFLVGEVQKDPETGLELDVWDVYSNEELTRKGNPEDVDGVKVQRWQVDRGDGHKRVLPVDSIVIRIWRPHPRKWVEADSPTRSMLPVLREVEQLTKHIAAAVDSRLAGAGVLFMPSEITFESPTPRPAGPTTPEGQAPAAVVSDGDAFMADLMQAMLTPIADRSAASAMVPIVVRAPGALIGNVKHVTFSTPLDDKALSLREEGIRRLALAGDAPPEVLLGLADSNHWSAWQIDESSIKTNVHPTLSLVANGLTTDYLRPAVRALGATVNPLRRIAFDTTDLKLRPDRSREAIDLNAALLLKDDAALREAGFEGSDAPNAEELKAMVIRRLAQAGDPTALQLLGLDVPTPTAPATTPAPVAPAPSDSTDGDRSLPDAQAAAAVLAAGELLVTRALERAEKRLGKRRGPHAADRMDSALHDAWTSAGRTASLLGVDPEWFTYALDRYTRAILNTPDTEHHPFLLSRVLAERELPGGPARG